MILLAEIVRFYGAKIQPRSSKPKIGVTFDHVYYEFDLHSRLYFCERVKFLLPRRQSVLLFVDVVFM